MSVRNVFTVVAVLCLTALACTFEATRVRWSQYTAPPFHCISNGSDIACMASPMHLRAVPSLPYHQPSQLPPPRAHEHEAAHATWVARNAHPPVHVEHLDRLREVATCLRELARGDVGCEPGATP